MKNEMFSGCSSARTLGIHIPQKSGDQAISSLTVPLSSACYVFHNYQLCCLPNHSLMTKLVTNEKYWNSVMCRIWVGQNNMWMIYSHQYMNIKSARFVTYEKEKKKHLDWGRESHGLMK